MNLKLSNKLLTLSQRIKNWLVQNDLNILLYGGIAIAIILTTDWLFTGYIVNFDRL